VGELRKHVTLISLYKDPCLLCEKRSFFSIVAAGSKEPGGKARPQPFSIGDTGVVYLLLALTSGGGGGQEAGALVHRRRGRPQPSSPSISQVGRAGVERSPRRPSSSSPSQIAGGMAGHFKGEILYIVV